MLPPPSAWQKLCVLKVRAVPVRAAEQPADAACTFHRSGEIGATRVRHLRRVPAVAFLDSAHALLDHSEAEASRSAVVAALLIV
jgi:hypothetical protein